MSNEKTTVILGGGIIGLSTAWYMVQDELAQSGTKPSILVLDSASDLFAGASGGGTGILGDYGFKPEATDLGVLSWDLFKNMSKEWNGEENWNWSDIYIQSVSFSNDSRPGYGDPVPRALPGWFKSKPDYREHWIAGPAHAARIDSLMFCQWLRAQLEKSGVRILTNAWPQGLSINADTTPQTFNISYKHLGEDHIRKFDNLLIAAGPWSQRVLSTLFPASTVSIPFNLTSAGSNHMRVLAPNWTSEDNKRGCDQLYLADILGHSLDISSYRGGTLYVGGYGSTTADLPEFAQEVHAQPDAVTGMKELCAQVLNLSEGEEVQIINTGRCYRPVVTVGRPIITQMGLFELFGPQHVPEDISGSFFLNTGHGSDGITLGPGSGKVMSDLIRGRKPTVNISGLGLPEGCVTTR